MDRASHHRAWLPTLVAFAIAALALAACGSSSATKVPSPAASDTAATSQAPEATASASPEATASDSSAPSADTGSATGIAGAETKLADIGSYRFSVAMSGKGVTGALGQSGGAITMSGTVILKPQKALRFEMTGFSPGGSGSSGGGKMVMTIIGDKGWLDLGTGSAIAIPAGSGDSMTQSFDAFRPEKLFSSTFDAYGSGFQAAGEEQKNGVDSVHYKANSDVLNRFAGAYGAGNWAADVWLAKDGGYPVSSTVEGTITSGDNAGEFKITIDITNVDDPANKVEAPAS